MMVESETGVTSSKLVQSAIGAESRNRFQCDNEKFIWTMADYGSPGPPLQHNSLVQGPIGAIR